MSWCWRWREIWVWTAAVAFMLWSVPSSSVASLTNVLIAAIALVADSSLPSNEKYWASSLMLSAPSGSILRVDLL